MILEISVRGRDGKFLPVTQKRSNMKRLLIITNQPSPYRVDFFAFLQGSVTDYEIHILFQSGNEATFRKWKGGEEKLQNVHILKSGIIRTKGYTVNEHMIPFNIVREMRHISPDIIVASEYNIAAIFARTFAQIHHIPYVSWSDGTRHSERHIGLLQKISRKYIVRGADSFIASSSGTRENQIFLGARPERIFISELCVDQTRFREFGTDSIDEKNRDETKLLFVGDLIPRKGLDLLLGALYRIKDIPFTLNIVGNGTEAEKADMIGLIHDLGLDEKVRFSGFLSGDALLEAYREASVFVFPTREDCFGLVLLEAMAAGLPVISSRYAGASADLVKFNRNGFIIDPTDPVRFSKVLKKVLKNKEMRSRMGKESRKMALEFDFEHTAPGFMEAVRAAEMRQKLKEMEERKWRYLI